MIERIIEIASSVHGFRAPSGTAGESMDWEALHHEAERHGVILLLNEHAARHELPVPEPVREKLLRAGARHARLAAETAEVGAVFEAAGMEWLIYKGQALESRYYDGRLRDPGDLDVLIGADRIEEAAALLSERGYRPLRAKPAKAGFALELERGGFVVDLHDSLVERHIAELPGHHELWSRREVLRPDRWTLSDVDCLLALLVHGFKHHWCRLRWVLDVSLCLRRMSPAALREMMALAKSTSTERIALSGIALARSIFPPGTGPEIERVSEALGNHYAHRLLSDRGRPSKTRNLAAHMLGLGSPARIARYLYGRARY